MLNIKNYNLIRKKVKLQIASLYYRYIKGNDFLAEHRKWLAAEGDTRLRLLYPLTPHSVVFDVGGYLGDFTAELVSRYDCNVWLFEPIPDFYHTCVQRFLAASKVVCLPYGLSDKPAILEIKQDADASGAFNPVSSLKPVKSVEFRDFASAYRDTQADKIHLLKINIEGGEYSLIQHLIDSGLINKIEHIQVQFHNFFPNAISERDRLRSLLAQTHRQEWCFPFIWESWISITNIN